MTLTFARLSTPLALILVAAVVGCSPAPRVQVQTTPGIDFTKYRTYAIKPGNIVYPGSTDAGRQQIAQRLQDAVAMELEARGLAPQPEGPDLIVTYTASAQPTESSGPAVRAAEGVNVRGPGGNPYDEPGGVAPRELPDASVDQEFRRKYTEGNLVIDLLDGKSRRLTWRAMANAEIDSNRGGKRLEQVVARAFEQFPRDKGATTTTKPATTAR
jgi:hypothetical protein